MPQIAENKAFFDKYKNVAIWQHILYGIPASITLAQAAVESNYGKSKLAIAAKNFFGIKAYSNPDNLPVILVSDDKPNEPFRVYANEKESFYDHSKFLKTNSRYDFLFSSSDPKFWAEGLKRAGYATAPTYDAALIKIINDNGLQKYDVWGNNRKLIFIGFGIVFLAAAYFLYQFLSKKVN